MASKEIVQIRDNQPNQPEIEERLTQTAASVPHSLISSGMKVNKKAINAFLVVATLIASVTFGAAFALSLDKLISERDTNGWRRMASLSFVLCDVGAMYTSVLAIVFLIWAQIDDDKLVATALEFSAALIGISLVLMTLAFTVGVLIVIRELAWLLSIVVCIAAFFITVLVVLLFPLFVHRTKWSYPFYAIILYWRQSRQRN